MAEIKTKENDASVLDFLGSVENERRRTDGLALYELFNEATGLEPRMWGTSIVGYGKYHYKSERSSQEGDWPLTGFSPRKANLTLYVMSGFSNLSEKLSRLGKHKTSKGCLYINKLADVNKEVLREIIIQAYQDAKRELLGE